MNKALRVRVLGLMFCLGAFSTITQVVLMREMLVVFFGNELTIAAILASWLVCVGSGAALARSMVNRFSVLALRRLLAVLALALCVILPVELYVVRDLPSLLGMPFGEFAMLQHIVLGALVICAPACLLLGFSFPVACGVLTSSFAQKGGDPRDVTRVYGMEACGSMAAGLVVTFVLLVHATPVAIALTGVALAVLAGGLMLPWRGGVTTGVVCAVALTAMAVWNPPWLTYAQQRLDRLRWESFGILSEAPDNGSGIRLVQSRNSMYQNLAVTVLQDQYTLYGNGDILFDFPDSYGDEHAMHFIMAQNPGARRVLMLGANPLGEIEEVLKYPVETVVYVELDAAILDVLAVIKPDRLQAVLTNPRLTTVVADGVQYLQGCRERFDIVIVKAPAPTTAAANRFYTEAFFRSVARVLSPKGCMCTSVEASVRLMDDAAVLGGSVYQTLNAVFDTVLMTAESEPRFLAGPAAAPLTFDRQTLFARSRKAAVETQYFHPAYFLGDDALNVEKRAKARARFAAVDTAINTTMRPVTYFNNLLLWSRFSESGMTPLLRWLRTLRPGPIWGGILLFGAMGLLVSLGIRRGVGRGSVSATRWGRAMVTVLLATTGACGMALEVLLIFVFQSLYGYVYVRIGLIVGLFMLGLVTGAPSGRLLAARGYGATLRALGALEVALLSFACLVPVIMQVVAGSNGGALPVWMGEAIIYACVVFVGWAVGAEFPLANGIFYYTGTSASTAAAVTDASDHLGAAVGALLVGVVLLPVLGITATGLVLAAIKTATLLCLVGVALTIRPESSDRNPDRHPAQAHF